MGAPGVRPAHLGDRGHDLRPHPAAAGRVVRRVLAVRRRQGRNLGADPAAIPGDRLLPDRLGDAAPAALGAGAPGRERLTGVVEVDETYMGGEEPGLRGGRARGKKLLVGIAVEPRQSHGLGRCRMAVLPDAKTDTLRAFLADHVEEGATVITDGWQPYRAATVGRYVHQRHPGAGREANTTLPDVHRVASLAKRWLLGTHQGSADDAHLPSYLDEFVFRFNRRRSRSRGLVFYRVLDLAVAHQPVRYRDLVLNPAPPRAHRCHPAPAASHRPWTAGRRNGHGGPLTSTAPVKWIPQTPFINRLKDVAQSPCRKAPCRKRRSPRRASVRDGDVPVRRRSGRWSGSAPCHQGRRCG